MYVLDTNILIYFFKGVGKVSSHLFEIPPKEIGISTITLFELEVGIAKSAFPEKRTLQLKNISEIVNVLPFGNTEAKVTGKLRGDLELIGKPIGPYDTLIAGTALANRAVLVTHNTNEFSRIEGLQVEDWY